MISWIATIALVATTGAYAQDPKPVAGIPVNYDESKVGRSGGPIVKLFEDNQYGHAPVRGEFREIRGVSRLGKTVMWAGARDTRVAPDPRESGWTEMWRGPEEEKSLPNRRLGLPPAADQ